MRQGQQRVLASVGELAAKAGLASGMTVTHAQSLVRDLTILEAQPEEDAAALARLGLWCMRYAPIVALDPPDGLFVDIAGAAHLFQGEAVLLADLVRRLGSAGISAG